MNIEIQSVVDVAIQFLTQLHKHVFGSEIVPVRKTSQQGFVAQLKLRGKRDVGVFRNVLFKGCGDEKAAGIFIHGENFLNFGLDGAYCFTSIGILHRLDSELAYFLLKHLGTSFRRRDIEQSLAYVEGALLSCLIHEMRHEAQVYENVSLRDISWLNGIVREEDHRRCVEDWHWRLKNLRKKSTSQTKISPRLFLAREEDAFAAEIAAICFWGYNPRSSDAEKIARAKELILG